eukprot:773476-Heterocapsa_arctica.AAC.1
MVGRVPGNGLNPANTTSKQNRQDGRTSRSLANPLVCVIGSFAFQHDAQLLALPRLKPKDLRRQ